jgi:soluble lytic murein transglycosylase
MQNLIKIIISLGIVLGFSLRCSHTAEFKSLTPPYESQIYSNLEEKDPTSVEIHLKKFSEDRSHLDTYYWSNFKLGQIWSKEDPKKSCAYFKKLSKETDFPLNELAYLKEIENCPADKESIKHLFELDPNDKHKWIKSEIYDLRYKIAKRESLYEEWAEAAIALSKASLIRGEKIAYTEEALNIAKKLKNTEKQKEYQARIEKLSPSRMSKVYKRDYFRVAYDYRRDRKFDKAIGLYKKIIRDKKRSLREKMQAWNGIEKSHKLNRDKENYLKALFSSAALADRHYRKNKTSKSAAKIHHDAQIDLARALWTQGQVSKARTILETLAKWLKGKYPLDKVYWLISRMEEEKANYTRAAEFAELSISEAEEKSEYKEKSRWILAWNLKKTGNAKKAIEQLRLLIEETENIYDSHKYKFWLAHTYQQSGDKLTAYQLYKELGDDDPLGYYGLLSYRQRGENFPSLANLEKPKLYSMEKLPLDRSLISQVQWLIAVNEVKLAQNYVSQLRIDLKDQKAIHELYQLYIKAGHYAGVFSNLASLPPEQKKDLVEQNPAYLFPRPFRSSINEASQQHGVDPALIYSIIRQESSFIPHARSFADAYGLMQLIPRVATKLAKEHNVPYKEPEDLYKPYINIPLGTAFLRELWDKKKGQFIITAASYNASEKAVHGWIRTRYFGDPIVFIEDIPYNETKGYVKLVLRNFIWYKRLNYAHQKLYFPEWTLQGLEKFK